MAVFTGYAARNRGSVGSEALMEQSLLQLKQWRVFRLVKKLILTTQGREVRGHSLCPAALWSVRESIAV